MAARFLVLCFLLLALPGCMVVDTGPDRPFLVDRVTPPQRLNNRSPWYNLNGEQVHLYANYCGWDPQENERVVHTQIGDKVIDMVKSADELIVGTFFLFDNLYAYEPAGDYVDELADMLIAKKREIPSIRIVLMLDLIHKGWAHRRSKVVDRLVAAGVDVFYSDLLETRSAQRLGIWEGLNEIGRQGDLATDGVLAVPWNLAGLIPLPFVLDDEVTTVATAMNASLFKANHRKALVVKHQGVYEALITSWNPHNPSLLHENHAISVTGPLACYMYEMLREDVRKSLALERDYVQVPENASDYLQRKLPALPESSWKVSDTAATASSTEPQAAIATEEAIEPILMQWLANVQPDDRVRIQMFYLSRVPVVNAILDAAARTRYPIRLLLDPNRTGINYAKDGTPNAQVAAYLLERARLENVGIEIRWYSTHGEQNHAKAFTITNEKTGKYLMSLGSANWTRKNLGGINLEDNIFIRNSAELNRHFNAFFDDLWFNEEDGIEYSVAWDDPVHNYNRSTGRDFWAIPRRDALLAPRFDAKGRPELLEQELVHW